MKQPWGLTESCSRELSPGMVPAGSAPLTLHPQRVALAHISFRTALQSSPGHSTVTVLWSPALPMATSHPMPLPYTRPNFCAHKEGQVTTLQRRSDKSGRSRRLAIRQHIPGWYRHRPKTPPACWLANKRQWEAAMTTGKSVSDPLGLNFLLLDTLDKPPRVEPTTGKPYF